MANLHSPLDQLLNTRKVPNIDGDGESLVAALFDFALDGADGRCWGIGIRGERRGRGVGIAGGFGGDHNYTAYLIHNGTSLWAYIV